MGYKFFNPLFDEKNKGDDYFFIEIDNFREINNNFEFFYNLWKDKQKYYPVIEILKEGRIISVSSNETWISYRLKKDLDDSDRVYKLIEEASSSVTGLLFANLIKGMDKKLPEQRMIDFAKEVAYNEPIVILSNFAKFYKHEKYIDLSNIKENVTILSLHSMKLPSFFFILDKITKKELLSLGKASEKLLFGLCTPELETINHVEIHPYFQPYIITISKVGDFIDVPYKVLDYLMENDKLLLYFRFADFLETTPYKIKNEDETDDDLVIYDLLDEGIIFSKKEIDEILRKITYVLIKKQEAIDSNLLKDILVFSIFSPEVKIERYVNFIKNIDFSKLLRDKEEFLSSILDYLFTNVIGINFFNFFFNAEKVKEWESNSLFMTFRKMRLFIENLFIYEIEVHEILDIILNIVKENKEKGPYNLLIYNDAILFFLAMLAEYSIEFYPEYEQIIKDLNITKQQIYLLFGEYFVDTGDEKESYLASIRKKIYTSIEGEDIEL